MSSTPLVEVVLPPPLVVTPQTLVAGYIGLAIFDYLFLHYGRCLGISLAKSRMLVIVLHALAPVVIQSTNTIANVFFVGIPWFAASVGLPLVQHHLTLLSWIRAVLLEMSLLDFNAARSSPGAIRKAGLIRMSLGIIKWLIMRYGINPLLNTDDISGFLKYPSISTESIIQVLLLGSKIYCLLSLSDITFGLEQFVFGIPVQDLFNYPFLAYGIRDFWGRRWNLVVNKLLHRSVFSSGYRRPTASSSIPHSLKSRIVRALLSFLASGIFHELIIMSLLRRMTLENVSFFLLHGVLASIETVICNNSMSAKSSSSTSSSPVGWQRVLRSIMMVLFMGTTGRLFVAPFIRYDTLHFIVLG